MDIAKFAASFEKLAVKPFSPDDEENSGVPGGSQYDDSVEKARAARQRYDAYREAYKQAKKDFCGGLKYIAERQYKNDDKTIKECIEEVQRHCANTLMVLKDLNTPI